MQAKNVFGNDKVIMHTIWMKYALREAENAFDKNEIPVGCVIVKENKLIAKAHNLVETLKDPTAHSEILCITSAAEYLESKVLEGCSMYVTLEPCCMCAGAIVLAKIENLYFGAFDSKSGACGSVINVVENKSLNHKCSVYGGIMDTQAGLLLKDFFNKRR